MAFYQKIGAFFYFCKYGSTFKFFAIMESGGGWGAGKDPSAVRLFLSYLLGVTLQMGVIGMVLAMVCDWKVRAVFFSGEKESEGGKPFR